MKKTIMGIIFVSILITVGCGNIQIQPAEKIALQIVAQRVGYYVAKNNPSIVPQAVLVAQGIIASKDGVAAKIAINLAITELLKQFPNDPLLESDLRLIASGVKLDIPELKIDVAQLEPIITAFVNGMKVGAEK